MQNYSVLKVDNLMQSLENDEVKEADEKFGKWWKSATWWKVWKVMKVDNLMKSLESDETRQPDEKLGKWWNLGKRWKNAICFTVFLFDIFLYKRILPKSCSLILRWPLFAHKSKTTAEFDASPPISTANIAKNKYSFYFGMLLIRAEV